MSANCYRPSKDESEGQNERLTNKHIQTLALLQNLAKENQTLKTHVEQLEVCRYLSILILPLK